jgi:uncharacterized membrane protein
MLPNLTARTGDFSRRQPFELSHWKSLHLLALPFLVIALLSTGFFILA